MNGSLDSRAATDAPSVPSQQALPQPVTALRQRLAELRGPASAPHPLDARALAALAANPGCRRRALLDGAGVDKAALARALGSPAQFGQSQFAFVRGNSFEAKVQADGGAELIRLLSERLAAAGGPAASWPLPEPGEASVPDLSATGPEGRTARTRLALQEAFSAGGWSLLFHPMVRLDVAGSSAHLEPDVIAVDPDGGCTVVEIKSFPVVDGSADATKVGAAARQAAVYVLALRRLAEDIDGRSGGDAGGAGRGPVGAARVRSTALLVCPKDFSNLPTAEPVDVRKQLAVTRRQLDRLTRVDELAAALPEGTTFDLRLAADGRTPTRPAEELTEAVESVDAAYAPECLAACELAFHCRARSREAGAVEALGRGVRGELGGLTTVESVLDAALGRDGDPDDPAVAALRRAAGLRAEALSTPPPGLPGPQVAPGAAGVCGPARPLGPEEAPCP